MLKSIKRECVKKTRIVLNEAGSLFVTSRAGPGPTGAEGVDSNLPDVLDRPFSVQFRVGLSFPESDLIREVGFASAHIDPATPPPPPSAKPSAAGVTRSHYQSL